MDVNILVGRFQPLTEGHIKCIDQAFKENGLSTVLCMIKVEQDKTNERHPFESSLLKKMYNEIFKYDNKVSDIIEIKSADIVKIHDILLRKGYNIKSWTCGSDRIKDYSRMVSNYRGQIGLDSDFKMIEIPRFDEDISASKIRQAIREGNYNSFLKDTPFKRLQQPRVVFDTLKHILNIMKESLLTEGGNVFTNTSPIKKEYIKPTIEMFIKELIRIFPEMPSKYFKNMTILGSAGKKDISGDIDLALSEEAFQFPSMWGLDVRYINELFALFKKRSKNASDKQLLKRSVIVAISQKIEDTSKLLHTDTKQASAGMLFCIFPQYNESYVRQEENVQIDVNIGNIDWLKFAYYSDNYKDNIKGLHRTQLMLTLFVNKGYVFSHNYGVKDKNTNIVVADTPQASIDLLNELYHITLTDKILSNYFTLQDYLRKHLSTTELNKIYDIYLKILDSTRCDIPLDLQAYWVENQDRLDLKGKFLPSSSNLYPLRK